MLQATSSDGRRLPTIAEIEATTEVMGLQGKYAKVARVNEHFVVKWGHTVSLAEAENMKFIAESSKVPVPKVHAAFTDPDSKKTYIIMEYVPEETLEKLLPSLSQEEKATILPPGYLGMANRHPFVDGVFWSAGLDPKVSGPFSDQQEINLALIEKIRGHEKEPYPQFLQGMIDQTLRGHRAVFTHGDLQSKNIMADRLETPASGGPKSKVTLVDWEASGWYPEFWEWCSATIACRFKSVWLKIVPDILDQYTVEYLMMQVIYASVYY
ncbi:kinase-like domain-containing protein [Aspergillus carlsbadensis]|nr:kinase-like domain-containing protein [Aspergillus carlsbadensis]